jgi:photosystem II stability/assembly factor-like uncharacterized protein
MRSDIDARPVLDIVAAGNRLVGVGSRGLIILSDDKGETWMQASVPVQSDLLSAHFPTPLKGWAVGHDGVILRSEDGGRTWSKQLDGRIAEKRFKAFYERIQADQAEDVSGAAQLIGLNFKAGPALPYLDVWFEDEQRGFVVGSFGMIAATQDGGVTWDPLLHRIDNPEGLNLNSVQSINGEIFVVGERGMVFELLRESGRFVARPTGAGGSFFGVIANSKAMLAFGLRGTAYRSLDGGSNWNKVAMPSDATITAGFVHPTTEGFHLVNSSGYLLKGDPSAEHFELHRPDRSMRYTGAVQVDSKTVVFSGLEGVRREVMAR